MSISVTAKQQAMFRNAPELKDITSNLISIHKNIHNVDKRKKDCLQDKVNNADYDTCIWVFNIDTKLDNNDCKKNIKHLLVQPANQQYEDT